MFGAIIGDIIGSRWEFHRITTKQFPLFSDKNAVTDDSILTVAVADALMNDKDPAESLRFWGRHVMPGKHVAGYGSRFINWLAAPTVQPPYNSWGNGGAMRVSLGGDADTLATIAGGIAEALYGIPEDLGGQAWTYVPPPMKDLVTEFYAHCWDIHHRDGQPL